jgi:hypothetical protein
VQTAPVLVTTTWTDYLTDWPNLLQGGAGSVVGSALGVLGAYGAAAFTIGRQRRNDRRLLSEQRGVEAAAGIAHTIDDLNANLLRLAAAEALGGDVQAAWRSVEENKAKLDAGRLDLAPHATRELLSSLDRADRLLFDLWEHFTLGADLPDPIGKEDRPQLSLLGRSVMQAHDTVTHAGRTVEQYRRAPWNTRAQRRSARGVISVPRRGWRRRARPRSGAAVSPTGTDF